MEIHEQKIELDSVIENLNKEDRDNFDNCVNILNETISMYGEIGMLALAHIGIQKSSEAEQYFGMI